MSLPIDKEILKKVELIRIRTRRSVTSVFAGEFESAFKGQGLEFEEVREYQFGDEIRSIDWNVTARAGYPHVKRFREERELAVFFLVDMSSSGMLGSCGRSKLETAAEIVSLLSFSAGMNNDRTGLLLFTEKPELFIPLSRGMTHSMQMVREMLSFSTGSGGTSIASALEYLGRVVHRRSLVFLISDFYDPGFHRQLSISGRRHDIVGLNLWDPLERALPAGGLIDLQDAESGETVTVDSSDKLLRMEYTGRFDRRRRYLKDSFLKYGCDFLDIDISAEYIHKLSAFFAARENRA